MKRTTGTPGHSGSNMGGPEKKKPRRNVEYDYDDDDSDLDGFVVDDDAVDYGSDEDRAEHERIQREFSGIVEKLTFGDGGRLRRHKLAERQGRIYDLEDGGRMREVTSRAELESEEEATLKRAKALEKLQDLADKGVDIEKYLSILANKSGKKNGSGDKKQSSGSGGSAQNKPVKSSSTQKKGSDTDKKVELLKALGKKGVDVEKCLQSLASKSSKPSSTTGAGMSTKSKTTTQKSSPGVKSVAQKSTGGFNKVQKPISGRNDSVSSSGMVKKTSSAPSSSKPSSSSSQKLNTGTKPLPQKSTTGTSKPMKPVGGRSESSSGMVKKPSSSSKPSSSTTSSTINKQKSASAAESLKALAKQGVDVEKYLKQIIASSSSKKMKR